MKRPTYIEHTIRTLDDKNKFLGHIAKSLPWEPTTIAAMATDGVKFYYHETEFPKLSLNERVSVLVHEITHILNEHHARMHNYPNQPREFNEAADLAINPMIEQYGFRLPDWVLRPPPELTNRSVEYIMAKLFPYRPKKDEKQENRPSDANDTDQEDQADQEHNPLPWGAILPMPSNSKSGIPDSSEIQNERNRIQSMISDAEHMATLHGQDGKSFRREIIRPQDVFKTWEDELDSSLSGRGTSSLSWNRPSRGYLAQGVYMPSYVEEGIGTTCVIFDTSISQSTKHLTESAAIIGNLLNKHGVDDVYLIMCDTSVRKAFWTHPSELERDMAILGRGGTRIVPAIEKALSETDFDTIIYQTDLKIPTREWLQMPHIEANLYWLTQSPFLKAPVGQTIRI